MTRFWMVARKPKGKTKDWGNPRRRHYSRAVAEAEAKRLANLTGESFVILACDEVVVPDGAEPEALHPASIEDERREIDAYVARRKKAEKKAKEPA